MTHSGQEIGTNVSQEESDLHVHLPKNTIKVLVASRLEEIDIILSAITSIDVIGIDEGQFYPDSVKYVKKWARDYVIRISALDTDWRVEPFGEIPRLMAVCDMYEKLLAVCMVCGEDAPFTAKIKPDDRVEEVGGAETYFASCRKCHPNFA